MKKKVVEKPDYNASFEDLEAYNRHRRKEYKRMMRNTKRELVKLAKKWYAWDEGFLFDMMEIIFDGWEKYYTLRVNVYGIEKSDEAKLVVDDPESHGFSDEERAKEYSKTIENIPTREEIAHTLLELLRKEEETFWDWKIEGNDVRAKAMKDFLDYFAEYIHYMWD